MSLIKHHQEMANIELGWKEKYEAQSIQLDQLSSSILKYEEKIKELEMRLMVRSKIELRSRPEIELRNQEELL
jgi:hypothetical protein